MTIARGVAHGRRARSLVAAWVRLYTLGLPATVRGDRRDELASDLWEQATEGDGRRTVGVEIAARALLGVPADLAWRLEHSRFAGFPGWLVGTLLGVLARLEAAGRWVGRRGLPGITATVAIVSGLLGLLVIVTAPSNDSGSSTSELVVWGSLIVIAALAIGGGGRLIDAHTRLGGALGDTRQCGARALAVAHGDWSAHGSGPDMACGRAHPPGRPMHRANQVSRLVDV